VLEIATESVKIGVRRCGSQHGEELTMAEILTVECSPEAASSEIQARAIETLEGGGVIFYPNLPFPMSERERAFLDPAVVKQPRSHTGRARILYERDTGRMRHAALRDEGSRHALRAMVARYAEWARDVVSRTLPRYAPHLDFGRTSFRPCQRTSIQGLYISAYLVAPTQGRRMLRVFTNVDPDGKPRGWHFGEESFEEAVTRLLPQIKRGNRSKAWLLQGLGIIKGRRTAYDDVMRQLRHLTKHDRAYQRTATDKVFEFPSGSTWIVCTDGLLHGQLSGRFAFEQTLLVPVTAMAHPERSPLRILERLLGRPLL
jgi:hypothetical protein